MRAAILDPAPDATPLRVGDWPDPDLPPGWVLIRVARAALNHNDALWVDERDLLPGPSVIGSDAAGTVVTVADDVTTVRVGSEVVVLPSLWWGDAEHAPGPDFQLLGHPTQGTHAELLAVPAENVYARPARLGVEEAAALPVAGLTAWRAVVTRGCLSAGQTVVVTAASAGVGTFAVQIAAAIGARVVAVTSSPQKVDTAVRLGASAGVLRTSATFAEDLRDAVGPAGADLVVDSAGASWPALLGVLRRGGRLVNLGRTASSTVEVDLPRLFWEHLSVLGSSMGSPRDFTALLAHLEGSAWVPVVDEVVPLDEVTTAYARLDDPGRVGKVVLDLT